MAFNSGIAPPPRLSSFLFLSFKTVYEIIRIEVVSKIADHVQGSAKGGLDAFLKQFLGFAS
jgi:hypothetical protein